MKILPKYIVYFCSIFFLQVKKYAEGGRELGNTKCIKTGPRALNKLMGLL